MWVETKIKDSVSPDPFGRRIRSLTSTFQTQTVLSTVTATSTENRTYLQTITSLATTTATATATTTETQKVLETGLSECLGRVSRYQSSPLK